MTNISQNYAPFLAKLGDQEIQEFNVVASGTVTTNGATTPMCGDINQPTKTYKNYVLLFNNKSGQTVNNVSVLARTITVNVPMPNTSAGTNIPVSQVTPPTGAVATGLLGAITLTESNANLFIIGKARFQWNLAAASVTGTIDYALIGY
jgi:hypothetical protein